MGMTDLRSLSPPEWCYSSEARKKSRAECEDAYTVQKDGLTYACEYPDEGKCISSEHGEACSKGSSASPSPPPVSVCDRVELGKMTDLRSLSPPEWCYSSEARKKSRAECEDAYTVQKDGLTYACEHTDEGKCVSSAYGEACSKGS